MQKAGQLLISAFCVLSLAPAATAQSVVVDATATVEAAEPAGSLTTIENLSFGNVKIPRSETVGCMYALQTSDAGVAFDGATGLERPQVSLSAAITSNVYDATPSGEGYLLTDTVGQGCQFDDGYSPGIVRISCEEDQSFEISVSATTDAGAAYAGLDFYVPGQERPGAVVSCQASDGNDLSMYVGGMLYVPGTAEPYTGTVGTYTIDASFE